MDVRPSPDSGYASTPCVSVMQNEPGSEPGLDPGSVAVSAHPSRFAESGMRLGRLAHRGAKEERAKASTSGNRRGGVSRHEPCDEGPSALRRASGLPDVGGPPGREPGTLR